MNYVCPALAESPLRPIYRECFYDEPLLGSLCFYVHIVLKSSAFTHLLSSARTSSLGSSWKSQDPEGQGNVNYCV